MAAMDNPQKIVDAIIWVSSHPREELPVGWKARASQLSHHIAPDFTESFSADIAYRQIKKGAAAPATSGTLFSPMPSGTSVEGGVRGRMTRVDR
jgi:hypothetical protein